MKIQEIIRTKSNLILQLDQEKTSGKRRSILELASHIAFLEGELVHYYLKEKDVANAVVSLVSQGSCLKDARRFHETYRLFKKALECSTHDPTKTWLREAIKELPSEAIRDNIFSQCQPAILKNKKLRRPQVLAYEAANSYFNGTSGHAIIQLPVG